MSDFETHLQAAKLHRSARRWKAARRSLQLAIFCEHNAGDELAARVYLAEAQMQLGRLPLAEREARAALKVAKRFYGQHSPRLNFIRLLLIQILVRAGRMTAAECVATRAYQDARAEFMEQCPEPDADVSDRWAEAFGTWSVVRRLAEAKHG